MRIQYLFDRALPANQTDSEQALQTVAALARAGHELELVVPVAAGQRLDAQAIREHYRVRGAFRMRGIVVPSAAKGSLRKLLFAHAVRETETSHGAFDVRYTRNLPVLAALAGGASPFVYETYRPWFARRPGLGRAMRRVLAAPGALGAVLHSHYAAERYRTLGIDADKLLVAHNGHDPQLFADTPERAACRDNLGIGQHEHVVTYAGHVNLTKGIESIVALARRSPSVRFCIVGWDGKHGLTSLSTRLAPNVQLVRWQPFERVAWYLRAADVLLLPPSARGFRVVGNTVLPMKTFQYLAAARPILAPQTPDTRELLRDGENARLVPAGHIDAATRALHELLNDARVADHLARGAQATASALTWDARAGKIGRFLDERLAQHGAVR